MKLRFTRRAVVNLNVISAYLRERSPSGTRNVRAAIYEALENLLLFPLVGRRQEVEGVRKIVTSRYGYLIYYRVDEEQDELVILSIRHPAEEREQRDR